MIDCYKKPPGYGLDNTTQRFMFGYLYLLIMIYSLR
jgi:hypothetical protein